MVLEANYPPNQPLAEGPLRGGGGVLGGGDGRGDGWRVWGVFAGGHLGTFWYAA